MSRDTEDDTEDDTYLYDRSTSNNMYNISVLVYELFQVVAHKELNVSDLKERSDLWIADTGASKHLTRDDKDMINRRTASPNEHFVMGNGDFAEATIIGDIKAAISGNNVLMTDVAYCPSAMSASRHLLRPRLLHLAFRKHP